MTRLNIVEALKKESGLEVNISGWVRSFRGNRFISLNDGSCMASIQVVVDYENLNPETLSKITTGASINVKGEIVDSQGKGQKTEVVAKEINIIGTANPDDVQKTILQPKKHSLELLREQAHLRMRTNLFGAVFRIRHHMAFAIHNYFNSITS